MSTFIELTVYRDKTKICVNMDHVLQMYEDSEFVRFMHIPEGDPAEECHFTKLVYTDAANENILDDQVTEPIKEILKRIAESRLRAR